MTYLLLTLALASSSTVSKIHWTGLTKTKTFVVEREISLEEGGAFSQAALKESVRRLKNLRIFSKVEASVKDTKKGKEVTFDIAERWTTIPIAKFGGGGGTSFFILGVYDPNVLGRFFELGGQYENLGGTSSGVVWFRQPRLFGKRLKFSTDFWVVKRMEEVYQDILDHRGSYIGSELRWMNRLDWEINPSLVLSALLNYRNFDTDEGLLNDGQRELNTRHGFNAPAATSWVEPGVGVRVGQVNYDLEMTEGRDLLVEVKQRFAIEGESHGVFTAEGRSFWRMGRINLAIRGQMGLTPSNALPHRFDLGGLEHVRGYLEGQFRSKGYLFTNGEVRYSAYRGSWLILQPIAFVDAIRVSNLPGVHASVGGGIRFIAPKIYRLNLRVDLAQTLGDESKLGFSFGLQQFF